MLAQLFPEVSLPSSSKQKVKVCPTCIYHKSFCVSLGSSQGSSLFTPLAKAAMTAKICKIGIFFLWLEWEVLCKDFNIGFCHKQESSHSLLQKCRDKMSHHVCPDWKGYSISTSKRSLQHAYHWPQPLFHHVSEEEAQPPSPAHSSESQPRLSVLPRAAGRKKQTVGSVQGGPWCTATWE